MITFLIHYVSVILDNLDRSVIVDLVDCVVIGMKTELNCYSIFFSCIVEISFLSINFSNNLPKLGSKLNSATRGYNSFWYVRFGYHDFGMFPNWRKIGLSE